MKGISNRQNTLLGRKQFGPFFNPKPKNPRPQKTMAPERVSKKLDEKFSVKSKLSGGGHEPEKK